MTNSVHVNYQGMRPYLQEAVIKVNELFRTQQFYDNIASCAPFDLADTSPATIATLMRNASIEMMVDLYYSMSPIKNIDGFDDQEHPSLIHMNIWKLERPVPSLCNSLVHSCVHAVNAQYEGCYFGHGDLILKGKENTAPYRIGYIAQKMLSADDTDFIMLQHDIIEAGKKPIKDYLLVE